MSKPIIDCPVPLLRFVSPFPKTKRQDGTYEEFSNMGECLRAWGRSAMDGFYPLGLCGQWHGGIHFDQGTARELHQNDGVRCIADGEVIAWRYSREPHESDYSHTNGSNSDAIEAKGRYSTSFVLVRHRLRLPVEPVGTVPDMEAGKESPLVPFYQYPGTPTEAKRMGVPAPAPSLVFYSLYMNLLHLNAYTEGPGPDNLSRPEFWGGNSRKVGRKCQIPRPSWAQSNVLGSFGQNLVNSNNNVVGWIPQGTRLDLKAGSERMREIERIHDNWSHSAASAPALSTLRVYAEVLDVRADAPSQVDTVHVLSTPVPIAAGDLIGHMGIYERFEDVLCHESERPQVHVELFAAEGELSNFIRKCRETVKKQVFPKTSLLIKQGVKSYNQTTPDRTLSQNTGLRVEPDSPKGGGWVKLQPGTFSGTTFTAAGDPVWARRRDFLHAASASGVTKFGDDPYAKDKVLVQTIGMEVWSAFPLQASAQNEMQANAADKTLSAENIKNALDDQTPQNRWWYVSTEYSGANGQLETQWGWVQDTDNYQEVKCASQWEWPGFEVLRNTETPVQHQIMREDITYTPNVSPMLRELFRTIDLNNDGKLQIQEIHAAWENPRLVQSLSRRIIQNQSEWKEDMARWDGLDSHFKNTEASFFNYEAIWQLEKDRIRNHGFWDDVYNRQIPGGFNHTHPIENSQQVKQKNLTAYGSNWVLFYTKFPQNFIADFAHPLAVIENFGKLWHPGVRWPLVSNLICRGNQNPISNIYGRVRTGGGAAVPNKAHQGWDLYAEEGTDCYAIADGSVVWRNNTNSGDYGIQLLIEHDIELPNFPGEKIYAFYAHLSSLEGFIVSAAVTSTGYLTQPVPVRKGQVVCKAGKSGGSAASCKAYQQHLHFELRGTKDQLPTGFKGRINPAELYHSPPLSCSIIDPI